ncbi:C2H2-type zinc finger transcription factor [Rhizophagus clarus]|uniref:C2H2-type zinc finger transcription factor n=1 Tax=Rhizophagus clarus TaxID=94130 RepID=A0A8H3KNE8_9GLOM|nr:C2H2-type zinc finger transcription factor [Rhizophagus clarus]
MDLLPECLQALRYPAYWKNNVEPSLRKFLNFRLHAGDLEDSDTEHYRFQRELDTIKNFYTETSEIGQKVLKWQRYFKEDKKSKSVKLFWNLQDVLMESEIIDEKARLQWKEGMVEFEGIGLQHLKEASSAVQEKQILVYKQNTSNERNYEQSILKKRRETSSPMILREQKRKCYTEKETDSDSNSDLKSARPKRKSTKSADVIDDDGKITDEQIGHFDHTFQDLDANKMWILKSGRVVEKVIYEYARGLKYESYLHSFIISDIDKETRSLFRNEEWEEIFSSNCKAIPKVDESIINLMVKYSTTDLSLFRDVIFEPFLDTSYSKQYFDLNYVNFAYRAMHILWEKDRDFALDQSKLEGWYEHNIWSHLIDPVFHDLEIELVRGEGMSLSSSDRKNDDEQNNEDRKKIGRKGDGIFRMSKDRLELGAIETGKKWEGANGRKYITDSLKLSKMLRDMLVRLIMKFEGNEQKMRLLQIVGILHSGNRFQLLTMDIPKGYICRIKRLDFLEVAGRINDPPLAFVLKDILRAKAIIMRTLELLQEKTTSLNGLYDFDSEEDERSNRCTTAPPVILPPTFRTPKTDDIGTVLQNHGPDR